MKIAVINSPFTSHIGRMVHVFKELRDRGHEVQFWGIGGTAILAEKYGITFRHIPLDKNYLNIMQESLRPEEYYNRVFFPMALGQLPYVLSLCESEKPDILEANTRVFAGVIASEITGIPVMTHCCSGNSFAQIPEDFYGYCVKGDESEKIKKIMLNMGKRFFHKTDLWYNEHIGNKYNLKKRENAVGLCSDKWALAHSIAELSKKRIASLPEVIFTGPIIKEDSVEVNFSQYKPYAYISLGTCPWGNEQIKKRYLDLINALPRDFQLLIGLGNIFPKEELNPIPRRVKVFNQAPQIAAIKEAEFVICHGGCQTVHEALYHGKPVIGLPHYTELSEMINSVEINLSGCRVPLSKINNTTMEKAVRTVTSAEYKANASALGEKLKQADGFSKIVKLFEKINGQLNSI